VNFWVWVYRITWILIAVVGLICVICLFVPMYSRYRGFEQKKVELLEQKRLEELKLSRLRRQQEQFASDPAFVERTAREAGMVKSNEAVMKIVEGLPEPAVDAPVAKPPKRSSPRVR